MEDHLNLLPVSPDADTMVFSTGRKISVREETDRVDKRGVAVQNVDEVSGKRPDIDIAVVAAAREFLAGEDRQPSDTVGAALERPDRPTVLVPMYDQLVCAGRQERPFPVPPATVVAFHHEASPDGFLVSFETEDFLPRRRLPHPRRAIPAGRDQVLLIFVLTVMFFGGSFGFPRRGQRRFGSGPVVPRWEAG